MIKINPTFKYSVKLLTVICMLAATTITMAESGLSRHANILTEKLTSIKRGEVLKGSDSEVYISLGQKHGVAPGNHFQIIRQGSPLKIGEKVIGYEESIIGQAKIDRVREEMSIGKLLVKKETPVAGDKAYEERRPIKRMVIAQFTDNQDYNRLTMNLQDKLITAVIRRGIQVVERNQLEKVLAEQELGYSGLLNVDSAKKIGKLLGADAMLLGTISVFGDNISINSRIVDMESGDSITAAETNIPQTLWISELRGTHVDSITYTPVSPSSFADTKPAKRKQTFPSTTHRKLNLSQSSQRGAYFSDFNRGLDSAWVSISGDWNAHHNELTVQSVSTNQSYYIYLKGRKWKDFRISLVVDLGESINRWADICPRVTESGDKICFRLGRNEKDGPFAYSGWVTTVNGRDEDIVEKIWNTEEDDSRSINLIIVVSDSGFNAYIDEKLISTYYDNRHPEGGILLGVKYLSTDSLTVSRITFDDVKVTPKN